MSMDSWIQSLYYQRPAFNECVEVLGDKFPLLREFKNTPQDPEWHAEGDVHIHTDMVLQELYKIFDYEDFSNEDKRVLTLAAIFHDIAKPLVTKEMEIRDVIRVAAPKHEDLGRSYLATRLIDLDLDWWEYEKIINLVGEHQKPKLLAIKGEGLGAYVKLSDQVDCRLLYWLEVADMKGRICPDLDMQLLYLDEFKDKCEEYGVWDNYWLPSESVLEHYRILSKKEMLYASFIGKYKLKHKIISVGEEIIPSTHAHRNNHSVVTFMCGISGSGKSTYISTHHKDDVIISLDTLRELMNGNREDQITNRGQILQLAKEKLKEGLRAKKNIVLDATHIRKDLRGMFIDICHAYNALTIIKCFIVSDKLLRERNNKRKTPVPDFVIDKQIKSYEYPTRDETHLFYLFLEK